MGFEKARLSDSFRDWVPTVLEYVVPMGTEVVVFSSSAIPRVMRSGLDASRVRLKLVVELTPTVAGLTLAHAVLAPTKVNGEGPQFGPIGLVEGKLGSGHP